MHQSKLSIKLLALALSAIPALSSVSNAADTLLVGCNFKISLPGEPQIKGHVNVYNSQNAEKYALVQGFAADPGKEFRTDSITGPITQTKGTIDDLFNQLAAETGIDVKKIESIDIYRVQPGTDGDLADIVIYNDAAGQVLGKAAFIGWFPAKCN